MEQWALMVVVDVRRGRLVVDGRGEDEEKEEEDKEREKEDRQHQATNMKSNNPHLAGEEQIHRQFCSPCIVHHYPRICQTVFACDCFRHGLMFLLSCLMGTVPCQ